MLIGKAARRFGRGEDRVCRAVEARRGRLRFDGEAGVNQMGLVMYVKPPRGGVAAARGEANPACVARRDAG